jgi:hypothetical protein
VIVQIKSVPAAKSGKAVRADFDEIVVDSTQLVDLGSTQLVDLGSTQEVHKNIYTGSNIRICYVNYQKKLSLFPYVSFPAQNNDNRSMTWVGPEYIGLVLGLRLSRAWVLIY